MTDENFSSDESEEPDNEELAAEESVEQQVDAVFSEAASTDGLDLSELGAIDVITKERDDYLDSLRRLQADFENFRKRTNREQADAVTRGSQSIIDHILPILDALDLAVAHVSTQDESASSAALVQIALLARATLEKDGLERIDEADVAFDPTIHDAVSHIESEDGNQTEPVVVDIMRAGYRLKGKVIRPAMVAVKA